MSFNNAKSSIASASSFFSLAFSPSSDRSRLASETSNPPYFDFDFDFHLQNVAPLIPCCRQMNRPGFAGGSNSAVQLDQFDWNVRNCQERSFARLAVNGDNWVESGCPKMGLSSNAVHLA